MRTLLLALALSIAPASATSIFTPAAGTIKLFTLMFQGNLAAYDLREGVIVFASNPVNLGGFVIVGGDPALVLSPPQTTLVALNGAYTEGLFLEIDTPILSAQTAEAKVKTVTPFSAITDPALLQVPHIASLFFDNPTLEFTDNDFELFSWTLSEIVAAPASVVAIPEPATAGVIAFAVAGLAVLKRLRR